jgi:hypothetical protein
MNSLGYLLDKILLPGLLTQGAWEAMKHVWRLVTNKPLEEMYLDALEAAVEAARPRLAVYTQDGEVGLDRAALRDALRRDLGPGLGALSLTAVSRDDFLVRLATAMHERSVLIIGGHNLTVNEYLQIAHSLVEQAAPRFLDALVQNEMAFRRVVLAELMDSAEVAEEILGVLEIVPRVAEKLDVMLAKIETIAQAAVDPGARLTAERSRGMRAALGEALGATQTPGDGGPASFPGVPPPDRPPLVPVVCAPRRDRVDELAAALGTVTWLALVDGPGKGKSQLARAVAEMRQSNAVCWVVLRGRDGTAAELHLRGQLNRWLVELELDKPGAEAPEPRDQNVYGTAQLISESTGEDGLLIVDDLPDPAGNQALYEELCWIVAGLAQNNARMLTTCQRPLPPSAEAHVGDALRVTDAGSFTTTDVLDMLESAGAPNEARTERIATLILTSTGAHPSLIAATVAWLRRRGWMLDEDTLMDVLQGEPGEPVREHHRRRMLRLVDEPARKLLYRLSLIEEGFDRGLAVATSAVCDGVGDSGVLLDDLRGPWVEDTGRDLMGVTPLLRGVGRENLPSETQKEVHRVVAGHYLSQGTVDVSQAHWVALHLWNAEDYERFATFVIHLMVSAQRPEEARYILWATALISAGMEWPDELKLDLRIMLRAAQVRTRLLAGRDASALDRDLESLMSRAGPENSWALLFASLNTGPLLPVEGLPGELTLRRAVLAVRLLRGQAIIHEDDLPGRYEDIIWLAGARIRGLREVRGFLAELAAMTSEERRLLFESELAPETMALALDSVWNEEASRPSSERNWLAVMDFFDETQKSAREFGAMPLVVACARASAVVLADYLHQSDDALEVLQSVPKPSDADLSFLLHYTAGFILFDADRTSEALDQLDVASATLGGGFSAYRFHGQLYAAIADSKLGLWDKAIHRHGEVVRGAAAMPDVLTYERLEAMGELAWVHWATGGRVKACAAMYGFVTALVGLNNPTEARYREAFNKAGHALGWLSSIATTGEPPAVTASGEVYVPVEAGFFGVRREQMAQFTPPVGFSRAWLLAQLGMLAHAVGLRRVAKSAYELSQRLAEGRKADEVLLVFVDAESASLSASFGELGQAIDLVFKAVDGLATHGYGPHGKELFPSATTDVVPDEGVQRLSAEDARVAERQHFLGMLVGPALAGLLWAPLSRDKWISKLTDLQSTVSARRRTFRDEGLAEQVLHFVNALINLWKSDAVPSEPTLTVDDLFLKALWFLVASSHSGTRLVDSLRMQVQAVDFLLRVPDARLHILPDVGAFVHRFWLDIANTRSFALNSPQLFRQELRGLSSQGGAKTAVGVLVSACTAVGIRLPSEIRSRFGDV